MTHSFPKKYIAFFAAVPLLLLTSVLRVDCPVCGGSGYLSSTPGMENVELVSLKSAEGPVTRAACAAYTIYPYDITLTLQNNNKDATTGWVKLILREYQTTRILDVIYMPIEIDAESSTEMYYQIWFIGGADEPFKTEVNAEVLKGNFTDGSCDGTGKISANTWLLVKALKKSYSEVSEVRQHEFRLPRYYPPDWDID